MESGSGTVLVIIAVLTLGGLGMAASGLRTLWLLRRSRFWPSTEGRVISTEIRKRITSPVMMDPTSHGWNPRVVYEYEVDGRTFRSDVIDLCGRLRMTPRLAGLMAASYPVGQEVTVYYDDRRPQRACLVRGGGGAVGRIFGGGFLIGVGVLLWLG